MKPLRLNVVGDHITSLDGEISYVSGSKGYYTVVFTFDNDWAGLIPHITVTENGTVRADEVIIDNAHEVATTESGLMEINVYGLDSNGKKCISCNGIYINVKPGAYKGVAPLPKDIWDGYQVIVLGYMEKAVAAAADAKKSEEAALKSENNAEGSAQAAEESKTETQQLTKRAETAADNAATSEENSAVAEAAASQSLSDLLTMINSGDIILATDGKLPLSSIPATATQEIYTVTSEDELTTLTAQRGDLAELIEEVDSEQTITKTWQCLGDASVRENWVVWGTSYAVQSGNARAADNALNANMINNHRMVEMTEEEFAAAVKDENTYYLVY